VDHLQDQFGVALIHLENMIRGTIGGACYSFYLVLKHVIKFPKAMGFMTCFDTLPKVHQHSVVMFLAFCYCNND